MDAKPENQMTPPTVRALEPGQPDPKCKACYGTGRTGYVMTATGRTPVICKCKLRNSPRVLTGDGVKIRLQ